MTNFLKNVVAGVTILIHYVGLIFTPHPALPTVSYSSPSPTAILSTPSTAPTATPKWKPTVNSQPTTTNNETAQNNGSRTGKIIPYREYCTGENISVYENEILTKQTSDGKTYSMTQGDWDCYNRNQTGASSAPQNNNPIQNQPINGSSNSNQPKVNCVVTYPCTGDVETITYWGQAACDAFKASLQQTYQQNGCQGYTPTVTCQTNTGVYKLTQQQCNDAQSRDRQLTQQQVTSQQQSNATNNQICKDSANQTYNATKCNMYQGGAGSIGEACQKEVQQQLQQALATCDRQYPTQ